MYKYALLLLLPFALSGCTGFNANWESLDSVDENLSQFDYSYGLASADLTVVSNLSVATHKQYELDTSAVGIDKFINGNSPKFRFMPEELEGSIYLRSAMADRYFPNTGQLPRGEFYTYEAEDFLIPLMSFNVSQDVTVYVVYMDRQPEQAMLDEFWLTEENGWEPRDFSEEIAEQTAADQASGSRISTRRWRVRSAKKKSYSAGSTVNLYANGGTKGTSFMYWTFIVPEPQSLGSIYFSDVLSPLLTTRCSACHNSGSIGPLTIFDYEIMSQNLLTGVSSVDNDLINKVQSLIPHGGGNQCSAGINASPCAEIQEWYGLEAEI